MRAINLRGNETTLTGSANSLNGALLVRLTNVTASPVAVVLLTTDPSGATQSYTITITSYEAIFLNKDPNDTLTCATGSAVKGQNVVFVY